MTRWTHIIGGALAGGAVYFVLKDGQRPLALAEILAGGAVGGLLPDIDHPHSTISKDLKLTRALYATVTKFNRNAQHRGMMHSLLFALPFLLMALFIPNEHAQCIMAGVFAGYVSHLLLDCLNPSGCPLLFPWKKRIRLGGWIRTGGVGEVVVTIALVLIGSALALFKFGRT